MYFSHAFRKTLLGTTVSGDTTKVLTNNTAAAIATVSSSNVQASTPSSGFVTYTTDAAHGLNVGDTVVITGITTVTGFNGTYTVTSIPTTTSFVVASTQAGTTQNGAAAIVCIKATYNLQAGSVGLYDKNFNYLNFKVSTVTTAPFYLVQGSYYKNSGYSDTIGAHGGYQESVKSKMINPKYITRLFWIAGKAPVQQVVQIPLTAQSGSTNVGLNADTTYRLRVDVKGSPALRFLSHNIYRVMDSYTGPTNATNPTYLKDPVATLVNWKEQITMSPYFNQLVQARAYVKTAGSGSLLISAIGTPTTTSTTFTFNTSTPNSCGVAVGQRITGSNLPANSFITAVASTATATIGSGGATTTSTYTVTSGNTLSGSVSQGASISGAGFPVGSYVSSYSGVSAYTITFPTQAVAPTLSGTFTASATCTVTYPTQASAPSLSTGTYKAYNDVYGVNGGYVTPYTNIAATSGQQPTYVGQTPYIPGTSQYSTSSNTYPGLAQTTGVATGATIAAASTVTAATSAAHVYTAASDAASFTTDAFLELTAAYIETKFGNPTFSVIDNYDLEPLKVIVSLMDDSGSTVVTAPIGTAAAQTIGVAGIATEVQTAAQAQGTGETVLRELILTGRYRQEAFGDGMNVDSIRMREIEANPGVLNMMTVANRNSLYNKLCILHSVPRFNNPSGVFDNDQYLMEIAVPNTVGLGAFFATSNVANGIVSTITTGSSALIGDYIAAAANISASGSATSNVIPVEVF